MKKSNALAYVGFNQKNSRVKNDFYPTPPEATEILLEKFSFNGNIWECACGDGSMSKVLEQKGYNVYSSDLIERGYGESGVDFLKTYKKFDNIITNPPFNLSTEFTLQALHLAKNNVAMLNKLSFLEGINRKNKIFIQNRLKYIYVFSKRIKFGGNGLMAFAWFIFDKNFNGKPSLDWV